MPAYKPVFEFHESLNIYVGINKSVSFSLLARENYTFQCCYGQFELIVYLSNSRDLIKGLEMTSSRLSVVH